MLSADIFEKLWAFCQRNQSSAEVYAGQATAETEDWVQELLNSLQASS